MEIKITQLADLNDAARTLIQYAGAEKIFIFEGGMGAGKTTFIKAIAHALGVEETVSSPTFSIVNEYLAAEKSIFHFDFYRIKSIREAYDIGYEEYFYSGNICLIEWPEKIEELLPENYIRIKIESLNETERILSFSKI